MKGCTLKSHVVINKTLTLCLGKKVWLLGGTSVTNRGFVGKLQKEKE